MFGERGNNPEGRAEYDHEAWERAKQEKKAVHAIDAGRAMGVPEEEIQKFGMQAVEQKISEGDADIAMRFMENMRIGTEDDRRRVAETAALQLREEEAIEEKREAAKGKIGIIKIPSSATFADLFAALNARIDSEAGDIDDLHLFDELLDILDRDTVEEIISMENDKRAAHIKVVDFFGERGMDKGAIETYLPIKFSRKNKKSK